MANENTTVSGTSNYNEDADYDEELAYYASGLVTNKQLRTFGAPYQFTRQVDPVYSSLYEYLGRSYGNTIMSKAPLVTIIPGEAEYLPGEDYDVKEMTSAVLISGNSTLASMLGDLADGDEVRYYDFKPCYREYFNYVNLLCRALAALMELDSAEISGETFTIDGVSPTSYSWHKFADGGSTTSDDDELLSSNMYYLGKAAVETSSDATSDTETTAEELENNAADSGAEEEGTNEVITATADVYYSVGSSTGTYYVKNADGTYNRYNADGDLKGENISAGKIASYINAGIVTTASSTISSASSSVSSKSTVQELVSALTTAGANAATTVSSWASSVASTVVDAAGTFGDVLADYLEESVSDLLSGTTRYIQFYADPDSMGNDEVHSNDSTQSSLKSTLESAQSSFKELSFMLNSGAMGDLEKTYESVADTATSTILNVLGTTQEELESNGSNNTFTRILNLTNNIIQGENVIIPDIYTSSSFGQSHQFTVHLKALYGSKVGWFWDVGVPLMHLLALAVPKQASANTYSAPFLVKCYVDSVFSCNLGLVETLSVNKSVSSTSWTADGLPNEVDVTVSLKDLYSDLSITSAANPTMFYHNTSLVDYLAVTCGLSLVTPNPGSMLSMYVGAYANAVKPSSIKSNTLGVIEDIVSAKLAKVLSPLSLVYN